MRHGQHNRTASRGRGAGEQTGGACAREAGWGPVRGDTLGAERGGDPARGGGVRSCENVPGAGSAAANQLGRGTAAVQEEGASVSQATGAKQRVVVQKFGGSSVADAHKMRACAQRVLDQRAAGLAVVCVVSAMGDATDDLIALAKTAQEIPDRRELDQLLATGEQASVAMFAMVLLSLGVPAQSLTGAQVGVRTDAAFGRASIKSVEASRLRAQIAAGVVPVVAGFQGVSESAPGVVEDGAGAFAGDTTTLGRGGSDTTAVALAAALRQAGLDASCDIYKDVDGVFTADPRLVPEARARAAVTYEEMMEAAVLGSQVIHPRAVELARKFSVPLRVLHSHRPGVGTRVMQELSPMESRVVSSVVLKKRVGRVSLRGLVNRPGVQSAVFSPIAAAGISVDDIIQEDDGPGTINLTFTADTDDFAELTPIVHRLASEMGAPREKGAGEGAGAGGDGREGAGAASGGSAPEAVRFDVGLCTVSVVGAGMRTSAGVAAAFFDALAAEQITIENITTSEIRISCVMRDVDGPRAVRAAHHAFGLHADEAEAAASAALGVRTAARGGVGARLL